MSRAALDAISHYFRRTVQSSFDAVLHLDD
jgi:hypothetical protein